MYKRNERTNQKVYQSYVKRYTAMCILKGADKLTELYPQDRFFKEYDAYLEANGRVVNAIQSILYKQVKK